MVYLCQNIGCLLCAVWAGHVWIVPEFVLLSFSSDALCVLYHVSPIMVQAAHASTHCPYELLGHSVPLDVLVHMVMSHGTSAPMGTTAAPLCDIFGH